MSDGYKRKHESGYEKRKKREKRDESTKRSSASLMNFLIPEGTTGENLLERKPNDGGTDDDVGSENRSNSIHEGQGLQGSKSGETHSIADVRIYSTDPVEWDVTANLIAHFTKNIPSQNLEADFSQHGKQFGDKTRFARKDFFHRRLANGETINRDWLIYSPSTGQVFCYICKLFSVMGTLDNRFQTGFNDWKNAITRINCHEQSKDHLSAMSKRVMQQKCGRIDKELANMEVQQFNYWVEVLQRIVAVVSFLSERALPFRGDNEIVGNPHNGNYLGCLELLAKFDPFLAEHIRTRGNPGKGNVSYLSSTICNQFIDILATNVTSKIVSEIKNAKYYGISVDSTPDISHVDQLTVVFRYTCSDGRVVETFLCFIPIEQHDGEYLFGILQDTLKSHGILIENCRSQAYDNASNMSGTYSGVQSRFRQVNKLAEWVPCAAHSLNLVGTAAAESNPEAVNFFGIMQGIYTFLSASPKRWSTLLSHLKKETYIVQSLSETRWSARSDATRALSHNYTEIRKTLDDIAQNDRQPAAAKHEARSLVNKLDLFETALMCVIWSDILNKTNVVNKALQEPGIEINTVVKLYNSLISYFRQIREEFPQFESKAKELVSSNYRAHTQRHRTRKRFFDESGGDDEAIDSLGGSEKFRLQTFIPVVDRLIAEMEKRQCAYACLNSRFGFLTDRNMPSLTTASHAKKLFEHYSDDLEAAFVDEFPLFSEIYQDKLTAQEMLQKQIEDNLVSSFPNTNIALRIYLSIFGTSCEGERSFSKLKRIKNCLRSTMGQGRLTSLAVLSIESEILKRLNFDHIIKEFAHQNRRKVHI